MASAGRQQQQQSERDGKREDDAPAERHTKRRRWEDSAAPSAAGSGSGSGGQLLSRNGSSSGRGRGEVRWDDAPLAPELRSAVVAALTVGFANKLARRMRLHNGYRTLGPTGALAQLHPACSALQGDADGLLPEWLIYHELVATSRPYLRQVCPTRYELVAPLLPKLQDADVTRLSGGRITAPAPSAGGTAGGGSSAAGAQHAGAAQSLAVDKTQQVRRNDDDSVNAARARYMQRKQAAAAAGKQR